MLNTAYYHVTLPISAVCSRL